MDVKNEADVIRHNLTNILTELKKLNGKTIVDPLEVKRSKGQTMITVEVRLWNRFPSNFKKGPSESPSVMFPSNFASRLTQTDNIPGTDESSLQDLGQLRILL